MKRIVIILVAVIGCSLLLWGTSYFQIGKTNIPTLRQKTDTGPDVKPGADTAASVPYKLEVVAENLTVPWSIVFTGPDRLLISERPGTIRILEKGVLNKEPLRSFAEVSSRSEEGLMGLALDPDYPANKLVYAALAYVSGGRLAVKVVRFPDDSSQQQIPPQVILDGIPAGTNHAGTRIKFGADGKLYVTTGDATQRQLAQDMTSYAGKILRLNPDGSGVEVYAYGFRNSQGLDWDPVSGSLWTVDHGPSGFDGPAGGDEVNMIKQGANYGWPLVSHDRNQTGLEAPKLVFTPAVAPAALLFYRGSVFPQFAHTLFFSGLRGTGIYRVQLTPDRQQVAGWDKLSDVHVGRIRELTEGPDGFIYFSTSNKDGRGTPAAGDDKIYRLVPQ